MATIEITHPRPGRHGGWLVRLAGVFRAAPSRRRPKYDLHALPDHMLRDMGLIDSAPVRKQP
jgi:uncharacterized protein YjiS (DUF1127 family)